MLPNMNIHQHIRIMGTLALGIRRQVQGNGKTAHTMLLCGGYYAIVKRWIAVVGGTEINERVALHRVPNTEHRTSIHMI